VLERGGDASRRSQHCRMKSVRVLEAFSRMEITHVREDTTVGPLRWCYGPRVQTMGRPQQHFYCICVCIVNYYIPLIILLLPYTAGTYSVCSKKTFNLLGTRIDF
jgi:hypothetical protein